mmetsp:Transcript_30148/g.29437  ORF Transcript_30148/g.29437 Transcript_30148/m.29437 type:complete len:378 (-) Transcript_30148:103-1236(-)
MPQDIKLRAHSNLQLHQLQLIFDVVAGHPGVPAGGLVHPRDHGDERGLARPIRPEQPEDLSLHHLEGQVLVRNLRLLTPIPWVHLPHFLHNQRIAVVLGVVEFVDFLAFIECISIFLVFFLMISRGSHLNVLFRAKKSLQEREALLAALQTEQRVLGHSIRLRHHLIQVQRQHQIDHRKDVERGCALFDFMICGEEILDTGGVGAGVGADVQNPVEGEGGEQVEYLGEGREGVHGGAHRGRNIRGPDRHHIPNDGGGLGGVEEGGDEEGHGDLAEAPAEEHDEEQVEGGVGEEAHLEDHGGGEPVDPQRDPIHQVVKREVHQPVVVHFEAVDLHVLEQLHFFLHDDGVDEDWQRKAQVHWVHRHPDQVYHTLHLHVH